MKRHDKSDSHIRHHINSNEIDEHFDKLLRSEEGSPAEAFYQEHKQTLNIDKGKKKKKMLITTDTMAQLRRLTNTSMSFQLCQQLSQI